MWSIIFPYQSPLIIIIIIIVIIHMTPWLSICSSVGASVIISYRTTSLILSTFICVEVDLATSMAEMFNLGDSDQNEKLEKTEFIRVGEKKHSKAVP